MKCVYGLRKLCSYVSIIFSDSVMSKSHTNRNNAKGSIVSSNNISNNSSNSTHKCLEKKNEIINIEQIKKNEVKLDSTYIETKKDYEMNSIEEIDKNNAKLKQSMMQVKTESMEAEKSGTHVRDRSNEKRTSRKRDRKDFEITMDSITERKSERKRERKRDKKGEINNNNNISEIGKEASNSNNTNFLKGNKFKSIDIHKQLLVVKNDDDLKKLINKENVTQDDILNLKAEIEKCDKTEEKKRKNIIIPRVETCDNYNYITTKFQRPSHYIRYELYRDQVSGIKLNDGTIIHYDMLKEDELFLQKLNEHIKTTVTDDDFSKLIDRFEKATGKWVDGSEEINYKDALEISDELKLNYKNHIIKEIYVYWKKRRKALGKPLLRMLWASCHHNLPNYIVFRPKVKEKMTLRKHKKKNLDTIIKMHKLLEDFRRMEKILKKMRQRDEKKLLLIQLNAILFDQRKNEIIDRTYVCPMWNYFKDYKMEKIYKRFKKDKYYKNVYTNSITNNAAMNATATSGSNNRNNNVHSEIILDKSMRITVNSSGNKMDSFIFTSPLNPVEYENVVLIKRRGRNNRIWIDRKIVSDTNGMPHNLVFFRENDAKQILKCCDVSEYFPDYFEDVNDMEKQNKSIKEEQDKLDDESGLFSAFATTSSTILKKNDTEQMKILRVDGEKVDEDEEEEEEEEEEEQEEEVEEEEVEEEEKKGIKRKTRGKNIKEMEDLKQSHPPKKMKLDLGILEKSCNKKIKEESNSQLHNSDKKTVTFAVNSVINGTLSNFLPEGEGTDRMEKQEEDKKNYLWFSDNAKNEKKETNTLSSKLEDAGKNEEMSQEVNDSNIDTSRNVGSSSGISGKSNQMKMQFNMYKKYNRSLFQFDEMMDPSVNRENSLLCLSKYAQEQRKFLFYLENLLNFDNFNFEHKKRRRKVSGKAAPKGTAKGIDKETNKEIDKSTNKGANKVTPVGGDKIPNAVTDKIIEKETEKGSNKGTNKGTNKEVDRNVKKISVTAI